MRFNLLAMTDVDWAKDKLETVEAITRDTIIEKVTNRLTPTELNEIISLDELDTFHDDACEKIEGISTDGLYVILVGSQRNISNHIGKIKTIISFPMEL